MALAVDPQRGPRGANAYAAKTTCGIPQMLITELLQAVNEAEGIEDTVVLDLFAGFQSLREQVLKMGAKYVAVDIAGERKSQRGRNKESSNRYKTEQQVSVDTPGENNGGCGVDFGSRTADQT